MSSRGRSILFPAFFLSAGSKSADLPSLPLPQNRGGQSVRILLGTLPQNIANFTHAAVMTVHDSLYQIVSARLGEGGIGFFFCAQIADSKREKGNVCDDPPSDCLGSGVAMPHRRHCLMSPSAGREKGVELYIHPAPLLRRRGRKAGAAPVLPSRAHPLLTEPARPPPPLFLSPLSPSIQAISRCKPVGNPFWILGTASIGKLELPSTYIGYSPAPEVGPGPLAGVKASSCRRDRAKGRAREAGWRAPTPARRASARRRPLGVCESVHLFFSRRARKSRPYLTRIPRLAPTLQISKSGYTIKTSPNLGQARTWRRRAYPPPVSASRSPAL